MLKKYQETLIVIMLIKTTDFGWQYNLIWDNRWIPELPLINYAIIVEGIKHIWS